VQPRNLNKTETPTEETNSNEALADIQKTLVALEELEKCRPLVPTEITYRDRLLAQATERTA
jgi:hypothetical protein